MLLFLKPLVLASFLRGMWSVNWSTILGREIMVAKCFSSAREYVIFQHFHIQSSVDLHLLFNESHGRFIPMKRNSGPNHYTWNLLTVKVHPAAFREITRACSIDYIILGAGHSLGRDKFLVGSDTTQPPPLFYLQHLLLHIKPFSLWGSWDEVLALYFVGLRTKIFSWLALLICQLFGGLRQFTTFFGMNSAGTSSQWPTSRFWYRQIYSR